MTYVEALHALASRQKTSKGAPAWSRFVNRPLGRRLAALAFVLGLTPNQVTGLSAACSGAGIALLALGPATRTTGVGVCLLLVLGYALDSADGQLARLRGGGSPAGEWLDHVVDSAKIGLLHAAFLLSLARAGAAAEALLLPLAFMVLASSWFFTIVLTDSLRRLHGSPAISPPQRAPLLRALAALPTDYGLLCLVPVLLGTPLLLPAYGLLLVGTALFFAAALPSWYREMGRLSAADR